MPKIAAMKKVLSAISATIIIVNDETNPSRNKFTDKISDCFKGFKLKDFFEFFSSQHDYTYQSMIKLTLSFSKPFRNLII